MPQSPRFAYEIWLRSRWSVTTAAVADPTIAASVTLRHACSSTSCGRCAAPVAIASSQPAASARE